MPEPDLPMLVFGNVWDENQVLVSTLPVEAVPTELGIAAATAFPVTEGCPRGRFEAADTSILEGTAQGFGRVDDTVAHSGKQSIAIDPPEVVKNRRRDTVRLMLYNVYERDHRLQVWLRADRPMTVDIAVKGVYPANWDTPAMRAILAAMPEAAPIPEKDAMPAFSLAAALTTDWQQFTVDVPHTGVAVEGYELTVARRAGDPGTYWIDDVSFETRWKKEQNRE